jgi:hypothetical protein
MAFEGSKSMHLSKKMIAFVQIEMREGDRNYILA